jgi:HEAT repeat protein
LGVRREAARALGALHATKAGPALMKAAQAEGEPEVREAMLVAAGQAGDKRQTAALERFLDDSSESARFAAAQGLCALGSTRGFEFAKKRIASADRYERMRGVLLFEGARAKDAAAVLEPLLDDKDLAVGAAAARVLYQGGDEKKLDWLVLHSFQSNGENKLVYEKELEALRLADDQRRAILAKAGIK